MNTRDACFASLCAARLRKQAPDSYAPATQVAVLLNAFAGDATLALRHALEALDALESSRFDHLAWVGYAREHTRCVASHLTRIVNEEAAEAAKERTTGT